MARKVTYKQELVDNNIELSVHHLKQFFKFGHGANSLKTKAVHDVSFDIKKGECFGLVGESGCGKTTTGRSLIRLYHITSGSVYFEGYRISAGKRWNEKEIKWSKIKGNNKIKALEHKEKEEIFFASIDDKYEAELRELYAKKAELYEELAQLKVNYDQAMLEVDGIEDFEEADNQIGQSSDIENDPQKSATLRGTLAHRMMELLANSKGKYTCKEIIEAICSEFMVNRENTEMLEKLFYHINDLNGYEQVNSDVKKDILKEIKDAKTVMCEVPFAYMHNNSLYNGVMDLVYEDKNGNWHIIDYKTNEESDNSKLEEEYKEQLKYYLYAFKETMGIDNVDAHIYHLNIKIDVNSYQN